MSTQTDDPNPILGYVLSIPDFGSQRMMFGQWREVADVLDAELDNISHGETITIKLERQWTTQAELDALPDFDGW